MPSYRSRRSDKQVADVLKFFYFVGETVTRVFNPIMSKKDNMPDDLPIITEMPWRPPETALEVMRSKPWAAFLDSGGPPTDSRSRWTFLCLDPIETFEWKFPSLKRNGVYINGNAWENLKNLFSKYKISPEAYKNNFSIPFLGGIVGVISYDEGMRKENILSQHNSNTPEMVFAVYQDVYAFDRLEKRCWWISRLGREAPHLTPRAFFEMIKIPLKAEQSRKEWTKNAEKIISYIGNGDIFQANLTMRWRAEKPENFDELSAYYSLRDTSPAPFGAYFKSPHCSLLSASVERFLSLSSTGKIETRPIKGTMPLGQSPKQKYRNKNILLKNEKELAENLMITDLMRNDIGKVSTLGSVTVPKLFEIEEFKHILHLVSQINGNLKEGLTPVDLLEATIPSGSVTGAPKKRALEIIDDTEVSARGLYCGNLFWIGHNGAMDSSVLIRSLFRIENQISIGAGGGITWSSDPEKEYDEMMLKAFPILEVFR